MQARRLRWVVLGLVGLGILAGLALLVTALGGPGRKVTYQGKSISFWFRAYAFSSNTLATPPQTISFKMQPDGRMLLTQIRGGTQVNLVAPTNREAQAAWLNSQLAFSSKPVRDPAWEALQAIGSNGVPFLISQLHDVPFESTYARAFTNLPVLMQKKLPHPGERPYLRVRALNALSKLGDPDGEATPALLDLLRKRDPFLQFAVYEAIRSLGVDRRLTGLVLLELAAKGRNNDVLEIAERIDWEGDDTARLLGRILASPDAAQRRRAITLLERSSGAAAPALEAILVALKDTDAEVRYMSVRTLEGMGASTSEVINAVRPSLNDSNVMVQTVAKRILSKIATETIRVDAVKHELVPSR